MAPIGKTIPPGNSFFLKGKNGHSNGIDEENKIFHHGIFIKSEDEEDSNSYGAMNDDEGVVIKTEEISEDEFEKSDIDVDDIDDVKSENEGSDRSSSQGDSVDEPGKSLLCRFCGKQFTRAFYFNLHVKTHETSTSNSPNKPHKCQECGKTFALLQHLTGHSRTHIASRYFECPICRRKFTELSNLTMHLLKTHPDEKPYKCSECDKQFTQSSALKKHMRTHGSVVSQDEIDRIDMLFYVENCNEKDTDEPVRKKIKLEEERTTPIKETWKEKGRQESKSPCVSTNSPPMNEKSISPKRKSPPKIKLCQPVHKSALVENLVVQIKEEDVSSDEEQLEIKESLAGISFLCDKEPSTRSAPTSPQTSNSAPRNKGISTSDSDVSAAMMSPGLSASAVLEKDAIANEGLSPPMESSNMEASAVELSNSNDLKDSSPLTNGASSLPCSQRKAVKSACGQNDCEISSGKVISPLHILPDPDENNMVTVVIKEEVENEIENVSSMCNGERGFKGKSTFGSFDRNKTNWLSGRDSKKSDKRDPVPSIEKPDGVYEVCYKCHRCELFYDSEEKLHEHLMDHTGVKLCECRFCGKDFTKMTSLKRHLYYHVVGTIPQDCTRCGKSFSSFKDLKDHCANNKCVSSAKAQFKCFRCRKNISSLKRLKIHLLSQCNEEPVQYYLPKEDSDNSSPDTDSDGLSTKVSASSQEEKDASKVGTEFSKLSSRWVNQKFEKKVPKEDPDMQSLNLESDDKEALQILSELDNSYQEEEIWNLQCQSCGEKFENALQAKVHSKDECLAKSGSNTSLEKETLKIKVVFEEDKDLQCSLTCSECDMKVVGVEKMLLHIKEHIYERNSLSCPVLKCGKLFKDPKEFKLHLKGHTGHKPFKCADCGKRFFLRENFENHAQRHGILKNWSSLNAIIGENCVKGKGASAKSPITIESTIANLEAAEPDVDRKLRWTPHATTQPISDREEFKPTKKIKVEKKMSTNLPAIYRQANHSVYKSKPAILKPSPIVNKPVESAHRTPPPMIRTMAPIHRTAVSIHRNAPPVSRSSPPTLIRTLPPVHRPAPPLMRTAPSIIRPIRPAPSMNVAVSPSTERPIHAPAGFLSLSSAFPVTQPRSYAIASPGSSKTVFSVANVSSAKFGLSPKDSNARAHPPSYYHVSENSRAHIQAANAELRKYPRSGRCEVCKKICSRLDKHMMVHLNQKPHLCPVCPQAFRQSEHLRRHIRAKHEGNHRQFECPKCHKRLTRKDKLKEHMKNCIRLDGDLNISSPLSNYSDDSPVTLADTLFDMIPGPHQLNLQGHSVE